MKVDPVKKYRTPRFPTRAILDAHPELLRLIPKRWQRNAVVLTAVAAVCALALGLRRGNAPGVHIAPLFTHGGGFYQGSYGGEISPPGFLSEAEARFIIRNEAAKAGLSFTSTTDTLPGVSLPRIQPVIGIPGIELTKKGLVLDGKEQTRTIWYEYVSGADHGEWTVEPILPIDLYPNSTREGPYYYRLRAAAGALQGNMRGITRKGAYGVFYDPMAANGYPLVISKGTVYAPVTVLDQEFPASFPNTMSPAFDKEMSTWRRLDDLPDAQEILGRYHYDYFIPLKSFCAENKLTYVWDAGDRTATVTDPATRKTVVFSSGGPAASKAALREQVRDFLTWLKAEGVI